MPVEVSRLRNGVTVATHRMPHLESVAMGLWIGAGARSELPAEHGISHLLEHMAFKGTRRRSARELAEAIEAVGGEMNAETSVDHTTFYLRLLKDDLPLGLDVLGDIVSEPLLDPDELAREQHVVIQEIGAAQDVPEDWVFELFQEAASGIRPELPDWARPMLSRKEVYQVLPAELAAVEAAIEARTRAAEALA